ncbi:MAG: ribulose-phosphate 3-epimerase [Bacilli bacterium]|nr:ribulose-phosphate 3-epimerase [Bacilli bacterium]
MIAGSFLKIMNDIDKIKELNDACDSIHYDVMDGIFTDHQTISFEQMKKIDQIITKPKDIHLMVRNIFKYVDLYKHFNPDYITFHYEAADDILKTIDYIKSFNIKVGLAINPDTPVQKIYNYLDKIDLVLVMSVFPGKPGQKFIDITDKIKELKKIKKETKLKYIIEVDGGINDKTIDLVKEADLPVVGSYITDSNNYKKQVASLGDKL